MIMFSVTPLVNLREDGCRWSCRDMTVVLHLISWRFDNGIFEKSSPVPAFHQLMKRDQTAADDATKKSLARY